MLQIISKPKLIKGAKTSNTVAGLSQILYKFKREDYIYSSSDFYTGVGAVEYWKVRISVGYGDVTSEFQTNDFVDINDGVHHYHTQIYSSVFDPNVGTWVFTYIPFASPLYGHGAVLTSGRKNYSVLFQIVNYSEGNVIDPDKFRFVPNQNGELTVDLKEIINSLNITRYQLAYTEYYNNQEHTYTTIHDYVDVIPARAKQGQIFGANMWEYLLDKIEIAKHFNPKVLKAWRYWHNYHTIIADYYLEDRVGAEIYLYDRLEDRNGNLIHLSNHAISVYNLQYGQNKLLIRPNMVDDPNGYQINVTIRDNQHKPLNKEQIYIKEEEKCNAIMLDWTGQHGGFCQWLFDVNQDVNFSAINGEVIEEPIFDNLENYNGNLTRKQEGYYQKITLMAENLTREQVVYLQGITTSQEVNMWLDKERENTIKVLVEQGASVGFSTKKQMLSVAITVILPKDYNFYDYE